MKLTIRQSRIDDITIKTSLLPLRLFSFNNRFIFETEALSEELQLIARTHTFARALEVHDRLFLDLIAPHQVEDRKALQVEYEDSKN